MKRVKSELIVVGKKIAYDSVELRRLAVKENLFGRFGRVHCQWARFDAGIVARIGRKRPTSRLLCSMSLMSVRFRWQKCPSVVGEGLRLPGRNGGAIAQMRNSSRCGRDAEPSEHAKLLKGTTWSAAAASNTIASLCGAWARGQLRMCQELVLRTVRPWRRCPVSRSIA